MNIEQKTDGVDNSQPVLGGDVEVSVISSAAGNLAAGRIVGLAGWQVEVVSRGRRTWRADELVSGWVAAVFPENKSCTVYTGEFGRMPISDRMRPRYLAAVAEALTCEDLRQLQSASRAELKGMFNRIVRRDQWDWFRVAEALASPTREQSRKFAYCLSTDGVRQKDLKRGKEWASFESSDDEMRDLRARLPHARKMLSNVPRTRRPPSR
jgi:hypothetical protein